MANRIETLLKAERRLLQDVSHELRSPLARLEFAVELARTSPDQNRSLDRIKKEIDRLSTLVSELLQVTRAESDPESRNLVALDLQDLIEAVIEDSKVEADARRVTLQTTNAPVSLEVLGDRELLRRAIENVLRNAIRYAPEESQVEIRLLRLGTEAVISIRDFGPGVPPESLPHLFEPFFRAEADRNRNSGGGVGLGLSIAERAVVLHNGSILAQNSLPGLQVEIKLPTGGVAAKASDQQRATPALHSPYTGIAADTSFPIVCNAAGYRSTPPHSTESYAVPSHSPDSSDIAQLNPKNRASYRPDGNGLTAAAAASSDADKR